MALIVKIASVYGVIQSMKISELIAKLTELKEKHGDLTCVAEYCENFWACDVDSVVYMKGREVRERGDCDGKIMDVIWMG